MRMMVHGLKSLIRRPIKTAMLFVIFMIVFNLVFTGFMIDNSIAESKKYIRTQIGAAVEYRMDFMRAITNNMMRPPALSLQVAKKIAENPNVKSYFISENVNANSATIDPAETQASGGGFQRNASEFILSGSNQIVPLDLMLGNITLVSGNSLSEKNLTNGDYVVLVSQDVAKKNDLRIGDTISLARATFSFVPGQPGGINNNNNNNSTSTADAANYEVIGIYEAKKADFNVNTMFTSLTVTNVVNGTAGADSTNASIVYLLDSPDNVEAFKKAASPYLTSEHHTLYSNDDEYESLTKPLNLLSFITSLLIWVVFIAGAAIILTIVTIFVRDRKFEIGLLLSSGEGKMKIVSQFIIEMLIIAIIAFGISVGTSNITSRFVGDWIVENQLLAESSLIGSTSTTAPNFPGRIGVQATSVYGEVNMKNVAAKFDVSLNMNVLGNLLFVSMLLVLAGATIPLTVILSYNPKRILQDY